jgi:hypothetical protein
MQDPQQTFETSLVHRAAIGAAVLHMRDPQFVQALCNRAMPSEEVELPGSTALALVDLLYGDRHLSQPAGQLPPQQVKVLMRGLTFAAKRKEPKWSAFQCWKICHTMKALYPDAGGKDFSHVLKHTVWSERSQPEGTFSWEVVFSDGKLFVSRLHALLNVGVPKGVLYTFLKAAGTRKHFFETAMCRDTVTILRALIQCTGLEDILEVRTLLPSVRCSYSHHATTRSMRNHGMALSVLRSIALGTKVVRCCAGCS